MALFVCTLAGPSTAGAEGLLAEALLEGLSRPTGLVARRAEQGATQLHVALAGVGRIDLVTVDRSAPPRPVIEGLVGERLAAGSIGGGALLVASGDGFAAYGLSPDGASARSHSVGAAGGGPFTSPVADDRFIFCLAQGRLWRARRAGDRMTELRPIESSGGGGPVALAFSPEGYLVALRPGGADAETAWTLEFLDPNRPAEPIARFSVEGLTEPTALVYGARPEPAERLLYVLDPAGGDPDRSGVYRIDAAASPLGGPPRSVARLVAALEGPTALAPGPDGALYATTLSADGLGVLLRLAPPADPLH